MGQSSVSERVADPTAGPLGSVDGRMALACGLGAGGTAIERLYQKAPLRVLFPPFESGGALPILVVNTSGGIVGGDRLALSIAVGPAARATAIGQAAEKIYRSAGPIANVSTELAVGPRAVLEFLPQGTILFDGVRLARSTRIELAEDATLLAGEILVFGRRARGERMTVGTVLDRWDVRICGRLVWADRFRLVAEPAAVDNPFRLDGAEASAFAVLAGPGLTSAIDAIRDDLVAVPDGICGATALDRIVLVRWLGRDAMALREAFGKFWARARHRFAGMAPTLPTIWHR